MKVMKRVTQPLGLVDRQGYDCFHISTMSKHTKPASCKNSILLISEPTSQTPKQPGCPQPKAKSKQDNTPWTVVSK